MVMTEMAGKSTTGVISPQEMVKPLLYNGDTFTPRAGEMVHMKFGKTIQKRDICIKVLFCPKLKLGMG